MKRIFGIARTATMTAVLAAVPAVAQDNGATGPASGSQDMSRRSPIEVNHPDREDGFDLGWLGLLGLAGLVGLRKRPTVVHDHTTTHRTDRI